MSRATTSGPGRARRGFTVDPDRLVGGVVVAVLVPVRERLGQVLRRGRLELLQEDSLGGDPAQGLAVRGAGHRDRNRAGGAVPGQPDDPDVVAEVRAAELRADAELPGEL